MSISSGIVLPISALSYAAVDGGRHSIRFILINFLILRPPEEFYIDTNHRRIYLVHSLPPPPNHPLAIDAVYPVNSSRASRKYYSTEREDVM